MTRIAALKVSRTVLLAITFCSSLNILLPVVTHAQDQAPETPANPEAQADPAEEEVSNESFPASFVDRILSTGNRIGFSVGVFHVYSSDKSDQTTSLLGNTPHVVRFTSAQPRIFTQFEGRRSVLRLGYGLGYRHYERKLNLNNFEHTASAQFDRSGQYSSLHLDYTYGATNYNNRPTLDTSGHSASFRFNRTLSPKLSFDFSDTARRYSVSQTLRSAFDSGQFSLSSLGYSGALTALLQDFIFLFGRDIYLGDEQVTTNVASAGLSYNWTRRSNIRVTGSYDFQASGDDRFDNLQAVQVGIRGDYRINEWLFFDAGYTTYVNGIDNRVQGATIHRLQVGGFRHRTRSGFELAASGGVDYSRHLGQNQAGSSIYASVSKSLGPSNLALSYHRGFTVLNGPGSVLSGDDVTASFSTWLTSRINLDAGSSYLRGHSANSAVFEHLTASGNIGFAIQRHLLLSVQGSYIKQKATNLSLDGIDRYSVSGGVHYFLPSLHSR